MVALFPLGMPLAAFIKLYNLRHRINRRDEQGRTRESVYYGSAGNVLASNNSGKSPTVAATTPPPAAPKPKLRSMDTPHNLVS